MAGAASASSWTGVESRRSGGWNSHVVGCASCLRMGAGDAGPWGRGRVADGDDRRVPWLAADGPRVCHRPDRGARYWIADESTSWTAVHPLWAFPGLRGGCCPFHVALAVDV